MNIFKYIYILSDQTIGATPFNSAVKKRASIIVFQTTDMSSSSLNYLLSLNTEEPSAVIQQANITQMINGLDSKATVATLPILTREPVSTTVSTRELVLTT